MGITSSYTLWIPGNCPFIEEELRNVIGPFTVDFGDYAYVIRSSKKTVAGFTLKEFPGCCGIAISTRCWVEQSHQNKGIGSILNRLRIELARSAGYTVLVCTDLIDNKPQRQILQKNGWEDVLVFVNKRTDHKLALSVKML